MPNSNNSIINSLWSYIQCVIILLVYVFLFFYKNDSLLVIVFVYALFLGFTVIKNRSSLFLSNNSSIFLLIFMFLYGVFNLLIEYILYDDISVTIYTSTIIYGMSIPSYLLGTALIKPTLYRNSYLKGISFKKKETNYSWLLLLILLLFISYKSYDFYIKGLFFNPGALQSISRLELFEDVSQSSILLSLLISSIFLYFIFYFKQISIKQRLLIVVFLLYYICMELSVGNRKEFVPMIIGVWWVFVNIFKIRFNFFWFLSLIVGVFVFLSVSSLRGMDLTGGIDDYGGLVEGMLISNEFVYPFYTLSFAVSDYLKGITDFYYGKTLLLYPILIFIPRVVFPDKPQSLASQFVLDNFGGGMGYAYSPVSESFVNFGVIGPVIIFFIIGVILSKIQYLKDQRFMFIFFTMIPDFCRGEISSFIYQYFFLSFFVIILPKFLKA